jgi:hypothetical protein
MGPRHKNSASWSQLDGKYQPLFSFKNKFYSYRVCEYCEVADKHSMDTESEKYFQIGK